jgi:hypothetical protein
MSTAVDEELLAFCSELIERHGGVIEQGATHWLALLPAKLARELELSEEIELGSAQAPLLYGSPLLDCFIAFATRDAPVVYGQIQSPYLKKAGFEQLIGTDVRFSAGQVRITGRAEARTTYMVLVCHYLALSDERKEGLVQVGLQESSGALVMDLVDRWQEAHPDFFPLGKVPAHFPVHLQDTVAAGMRHAQALAREELVPFLSSMQRRLQRDVSNTRDYYQALCGEMEASAGHPNLTEEQRRERLAKLADLPREMERKIEDLEEKYQVRVTVTGCAAYRLLVDVAQLLVELKLGKISRSLRLIWNPLTRHLDPLVCDGCRVTTRTVAPATEGETICLQCPSCIRSRRSPLSR